MKTDDMHRPTPEFRDHLEWEVTRTFRRDERLDARRMRRQIGWLRAAAVVLVCVAIGTSAGLASAQIRDGARRDSLLQSAKADAAVAGLRLQLARDRLADVTKKFQVGVLGSASLANAETELRTMEAQAMRVRYNIEEIEATAQPPRDDLNAPLVGGRDFVKDRLQLDGMAAQQRLTAAEAAQAEAQRRFKLGVDPELTLIEANEELVRARSAFGVLAEQLKLRREFLERNTPVEQLTRRLEETKLKQDAYVAQQSLSFLRERLALLEKRHAVGATDDLEVLKTQVEMKTREIELQQLMARLRALDRPSRPE